ncbi:MAG: hypothetical protein R2795_05565 [Saprospiraceae bacterium]
MQRYGNTATPGDDTYSVTLTAMALGDASSTGWRWRLSGSSTHSFGGTYGTPVVLSGFDISAGPITIVVFDNADYSCSRTLYIEPPAPCSVACEMTPGVLVSQTDCDDNNSPNNSGDDFYTVSFGAPSVLNPAGSSYRILLDGVLIRTRTYSTGSGAIMVPADCQSHTVTWQDANNPECSVETTD